MEKRFNLTVQEVLDKQFNVDFKGYSSVEVDEFLDLVIADYQEYDEMISTLGDKLQEYEKQINTLKAKIIELEGKQDLYVMPVNTCIFPTPPAGTLSVHWNHSFMNR